MIETRRESILEKLNLKSVMKTAVEPSLCKNQEAPHQMSFLPCLSPCSVQPGTQTLALAQKLDLLGMVPQSEYTIAINSDEVVALKHKTFTRDRRRNPKTRLETSIMSTETESGIKKGGKGGRKVQKKT